MANKGGQKKQQASPDNNQGSRENQHYFDGILVFATVISILIITLRPEHISEILTAIIALIGGYSLGHQKSQ